MKQLMFWVIFLLLAGVYSADVFSQRQNEKDAEKGIYHAGYSLMNGQRHVGNQYSILGYCCFTTEDYYKRGHQYLYVENNQEPKSLDILDIDLIIDSIPDWVGNYVSVACYYNDSTYSDLAWYLDGEKHPAILLKDGRILACAPLKYYDYNYDVYSSVLELALWHFESVLIDGYRFKCLGQKMDDCSAKVDSFNNYYSIHYNPAREFSEEQKQVTRNASSGGNGAKIHSNPVRSNVIRYAKYELSGSEWHIGDAYSIVKTHSVQELEDTHDRYLYIANGKEPELFYLKGRQYFISLEESRVLWKKMGDAASIPCYYKDSTYCDFAWYEMGNNIAVIILKDGRVLDTAPIVFHDYRYTRWLYSEMDFNKWHYPSVMVDGKLYEFKDYEKRLTNKQPDSLKPNGAKKRYTKAQLEVAKNASIGK